DGDLYSALVLSTHALQLDAGVPEREAIHRQRIASILQQCPRPVKVWNYADVVHAELSRDGKYVLIVSMDERPVAGKWWGTPRRVYVFELATDKEIAPWREAGDGVVFASLSPDGRRVRAFRANQSSRETTLVDLPSVDVEMWDLATQKRIGPPHKTVRGTLLCGTSTTGEAMYSITPISSKEPDGPPRAEVAVWDTVTGKQRLAC